MNWMNSRFAQWEVEGSIRERIQEALHEAEQGRRAQSTREAGTACPRSSSVSRVRGRLRRLTSAREASLQLIQSSASGRLKDSTSAAHTQ